MKILVCVKQVPDAREIEVDPVTNNLIREGVPSIINPFDAYTLEVAVRIKEVTKNTEITVLSMGPMQAEEALRTCLSVGADKAYLCCDEDVFKGSDTLATSYILASAIKMIESREGAFDLIMAGKQAVDCETGQVGPELAAHLGIAQVTYALEVTNGSDTIIVKRSCDQGYDMVSVRKPAVVTVEKPIYNPRYPSIKSKLEANKKPITIITSKDIPGLDLSRCGVDGSPTRVDRIYAPVRNKHCVKISEETAKESAVKLVDLLREAKKLG